MENTKSNTTRQQMCTTRRRCTDRMTSQTGGAKTSFSKLTCTMERARKDQKKHRNSNKSKGHGGDDEGVRTLDLTLASRGQPLALFAQGADLTLVTRALGGPRFHAHIVLWCFVPLIIDSHEEAAIRAISEAVVVVASERLRAPSHHRPLPQVLQLRISTIARASCSLPCDH